MGDSASAGQDSSHLDRRCEPLAIPQGARSLVHREPHQERGRGPAERRTAQALDRGRPPASVRLMGTQTVSLRERIFPLAVDPVSVAEDLAGRVRDLADRTENERAVADELTSAFFERGLYSL